MAENKKSFIVYYDWKETLSFFNDAEIGEIFRALFEYAEHGTQPDFSNKSLNVAFSFMKNALDRDKKAYEARCEKNRTNGAKGGRPKKTEENPTKPNGFSENPTKPKKPDNDNDNVNDTDNDNVNDNGIDIVIDTMLYGKYKNVFFTNEEYQRLITLYPNDYQDRIEKLSTYIKSTKKKYDNHLATIELWAMNEKQQEKTNQSQQSCSNPFLALAIEKGIT